MHRAADNGRVTASTPDSPKDPGADQPPAKTGAPAPEALITSALGPTGPRPEVPSRRDGTDFTSAVYGSVVAGTVIVSAAFFPDISTTDGAWIALVVAIVEQQIWGYAAVRRSSLSGMAVVRTITLNVVIGIVVVVLKFAVGH